MLLTRLYRGNTTVVRKALRGRLELALAWFTSFRSINTGVTQQRLHESCCVTIVAYPARCLTLVSFFHHESVYSRLCHIIAKSWSPLEHAEFAYSSVKCDVDSFCHCPWGLRIQKCSSCCVSDLRTLARPVHRGTFCWKPHDSIVDSFT